jgi:hypothetical protein
MRMHVSSLSARAWVMAVLTASVPLGCGPTAAEPKSAEQLQISQIHQLFHMYEKGQKPPPKGIKDVEHLAPHIPAAIAALKSKAVIVYWGAGLSHEPDAASTVLAYQKEVPEKGGEVLMQDGTAKKMTAEEFKAAKKPAEGKIDDDTADRKK